MPSQVYLYDCRFRDETLCWHHLHHSLRHDSLLHARHVEAVHVIPEGDAVVVLLCVPDGCQADVAQVWIHCGEERGEKGCSCHITTAAPRLDTRGEETDNQTKAGFCIHWEEVRGHRPGVNGTFISLTVDGVQSGAVSLEQPSEHCHHLVSSRSSSSGLLQFYRTSQHRFSAFSSGLVTAELIPSGCLFVFSGCSKLKIINHN